MGSRYLNTVRPPDGAWCHILGCRDRAVASRRIGGVEFNVCATHHRPDGPAL